MRALIALLLCLALPLRAEEVDVKLLLAVDVSRSMQFHELEIQRRGYAEALQSPEVIAAITGGMIGTIALSYVEWAGAGSHRVVVPWTRIASAEDAARVAEIIHANFETTLRQTSISSVLDFSISHLENSDCKGLRRVIDVSGDGPNNDGPPVTAARDRALARGIIINGLPLMTRDAMSDRWGIPDLDAYYRNCVIAGPGAFVIPVLDWQEFAHAVRRKLVLEIAGLTPPATPRVIPVAAYDCLIGEKIWHRNMQRYWLEP
ncbi:DUF1194 domain-containing protein [Aquicoccus porphyridii]|uniref:DUF1194 domain-containing protein n=1 Tax=Aquicoccus porphyridii TaxID=1852029 RepID=UPI00273E6624|nr:DUF1194 domain-containing protein [Aquicoccus porphyridii]